MPDVISSRANPLVRRIRKLDADVEFRREQGLHLLWGTRLVEESLHDPGRIGHLIAGESLARGKSFRSLQRRAKQHEIPLAILSDSLLETIAAGASDQGLLALVRIRTASLVGLLAASQAPLLLLADQIRDPGNLGALMRLAEAAKVTALVPLPGTVDPFHTRAARASAGSILRIPMASLPAAKEWEELRETHRLRIVATLPRGGTPADQADLRGPIALVVGNEGEGVSRAWKDCADLSVTIDMAGSVESLNVASAAAILLYEIDRQRAARAAR